MADRQKRKTESNHRFTLLAVDTATSACSVALADRSGTVAELNFFHGQTHSKYLAVMVAELLDLAGIGIDAVDAFAVDAGPGTFTGLRIGLATVKGLAAGTQKPAVGVSSLDALAAQAGLPPGQICCMLDARRGEVYTARYAAVDGTLARLTEQVAVDPRRAVVDRNVNCLYIGSGAVAYRDVIAETAGDKAWFVDGAANHLRASTVARLGLQRLGAGAAGNHADLFPDYIRRSDAEYNKLR